MVGGGAAVGVVVAVGGGAVGELVEVAIAGKLARPRQRRGRNLRSGVGLPATAAEEDCWQSRHCSSWLCWLVLPQQPRRPLSPGGYLGGDEETAGADSQPPCC